MDIEFPYSEVTIWEDADEIARWKMIMLLVVNFYFNLVDADASSIESIVNHLS